MVKGKLKSRVVIERIVWIERMVSSLRNLPLADENVFFADPRNLAAAESFLRRALEALLDLGRHIIAKGMAEAVIEYRQIPTALLKHKVITSVSAERLRKLAGYRNRMVHFYQEIGERELFTICRDHLGDVLLVLDELRIWLDNHRELLE